jgi:hypothetical protein
MRRKKKGSIKRAKLRFLVDHDASATAETLTQVGWRAYLVNPNATDDENVDQALQKGLSLITMDTDLRRHGLPQIPFVVKLSSTAQHSASSASAQIYQLQQLIQVGEITPALHQLVTMSPTLAKVHTISKEGVRDIRSIPIRAIHKGRAK